MVRLRPCSDWAQVATVPGMNDQPEFPVRAATAADVPAVRAITDAAYRPYIARIGVVPQPMEADHMADVEEGCVFVTEEPAAGLGIVGLVVVRAHPDHLFLDSIAVHPDAHGRASAARCCASSRPTPAPSDSPRSGSTPTP